MNVLGSYLVKRAVGNILTIWVIITIVFLLMHMAGDPAVVLLPSDSTRERVEEFRQIMGFDRPLYVQYGEFLSQAIQGDFGESFSYRRPAWQVVTVALIPTIQLAFSALGLAIIIGLFLGVIAAVKRNTVWDTLASVLALLGQSIPIFWLGLIMIAFFSVRLGWLPVSGREQGLVNLIMPTIVLMSYLLPSIVRLTRSSMLEVLSEDYLRTARAKGLTERVVILKHAIRNAALPVVTMIGLHAGKIIGGSVVTETIFAWPGIGRLSIQAFNRLDYPLIQATIFLVALSVSLSMMIVDILYVFLDPRIRYA